MTLVTTGSSKDGPVRDLGAKPFCFLRFSPVEASSRRGLASEACGFRLLAKSYRSRVAARPSIAGASRLTKASYKPVRNSRSQESSRQNLRTPSTWSLGKDCPSDALEFFSAWCGLRAPGITVETAGLDKINFSDHLPNAAESPGAMPASFCSRDARGTSSRIVDGGKVWER